MYKTDSIAILLATYNGAKFLNEQLESLLSQTYSDFRIYISDDLSTDSTPLIIKEYSEKYPDKIVLPLDFITSKDAIISNLMLKRSCWKRSSIMS